MAAAGQVALDSDDRATLGQQFDTRVGLLQEVGGDAQAVLAHGVPMLSVAALVSQADAYVATGEALRVYRQALEIAEANGIDDVSSTRAKEMVAKLTAE